VTKTKDGWTVGGGLEAVHRSMTLRLRSHLAPARVIGAAAVD